MIRLHKIWLCQSLRQTPRFAARGKSSILLRKMRGMLALGCDRKYTANGSGIGASILVFHPRLSSMKLSLKWYGRSSDSRGGTNYSDTRVRGIRIVVSNTLITHGPKLFKRVDSAANFSSRLTSSHLGRTEQHFQPLLKQLGF